MDPQPYPQPAPVPRPWITNEMQTAIQTAMLAIILAALGAATTFIHNYQLTPANVATAVAADPAVKASHAELVKAVEAKVDAKLTPAPPAVDPMQKLLDRLDAIEKRLPPAKAPGVIQ